MESKARLQEDEVLDSLKTGQNTEKTETNVLIRIETLRSESDEKIVSSATRTSQSKEIPMDKIEETVKDVEYIQSPGL